MPHPPLARVLAPVLALCLSCAVAAVGAAPAPADPDRHWGFGGGGWDRPPADCIPAEVRAEIERRIADHRAALGELPIGNDRSAPPLYRFYPQAGTLGRDVTLAGWVDLDPAPGAFHDFNCGTLTYDGHAGHDSEIRSWAEQDIGIPVFAAAAGTVIWANDGEDDRNTSCNGAGNYLIIDHGSGREGWYFHMRKNSLAVGVGDTVAEGQQIGLTASSGCSFYPHLHFESRQDGQIYEDFAGPCRPGPSGWVDQPVVPIVASLTDFGVTTTFLETVPGLPEPLPTHAQIPVAAPRMYFWTNFSFLPTQSTWRVRLRDPSGAIALDTGTVGFQNPEVWATPWFWWWFDTIQLTGLTGQWTIHLDVNGQRMINAPVLAVTTADPLFNRPPAPVSLSFEPSTPDASRAVFCRAAVSPTLDDPDWDVVSYRYRWLVDGVVVRDVVNAATSDAIPAGSFAAGQIVRCEVTPTDGSLSAPTASVQATAAEGCPADLNGDGVLDFGDVSAFVAAFSTANLIADLNSDGILDFGDVAAFVAAFTAGC